jgi:HAD superfamily hydrolase (TIGR01549 family)
MEERMGIKAIFFDLDDTLHDHLLPFSKAFKMTFPTYDEQLDIEAVYKKFRDFSDLLWKKYSVGELTLEQLRIDRLVSAMKYFNRYISNKQAMEFQNQYDKGLNNLRLFPEVPDLIDNLKSKGIHVGIITNGPVEHQFNKIKLLGLTNQIPREMMTISDEVGVAKPNTQIFHHVAERHGFSPNEILYIGDSWPNDVVSPLEAGWQAIWYNHRKRQPTTEHKPLAEVDQLLSILEMIKKVSD